MKSIVESGWLFLVIGVGLMVGASYLSFERVAFIDNAERAQGQVVEMVRRNGAHYAPRVRFTAADGAERVFISRISSTLPLFSAGERVTVLYERGCPANAVINSFGELWSGILLLGALGTCFLLVGAGLRFLRSRDERRRA